MRRVLESALGTIKHEGVTMTAIEGMEDAQRACLPAYLLERIERYIDERAEARFAVGDLAGSLGYSTSHFFRLFKRTYGVTPHQYVMSRRLAMAQKLIITTRLCLAEIALQAGFSDQSHLCRDFQRFAGLAPRAFRLKYGSSPRRANRADVVVRSACFGAI
jgi:AraC family transcriptional regulator